MQPHLPAAATQTIGPLSPAAALRCTAASHQMMTTSLLLWCWAAGRKETAATATDSKPPPQTAGAWVAPRSRACRSSATSKRPHLLSRTQSLMTTAVQSGWSTAGPCQLSNSGPQLQMRGSQAQPSQSLRAVAMARPPHRHCTMQPLNWCRVGAALWSSQVPVLRQ